MRNILITGAAGFIGNALCSQLSSDNKVIGAYHRREPDNLDNLVWEQTDLADQDSAFAICEKHSPDVVIHCAGIAHQKIGTVDSATYIRVNSEATENFAKAAGESNPYVSFIFLSSVSVYGEHPRITQNKKDVSRKGAKAQKRKNNDGIGEDGECRPSIDYAVSKLDAERRLIALYDKGIIHNLIILRLAPVYDREWSLNLDRRVFAPGKLAYIRFGPGSQKMSALARPNLVDFIDFLIHRFPEITGKTTQRNNLSSRRNLQIFNVCDAKAYDFSTIIQFFRKSGIRPPRPVIPVPLIPVWIATRLAGAIFRHNKNWWYACYDKLASDLVFDNRKMLGTGFKPRHSLKTIFQSDKTVK